MTRPAYGDRIEVNDDGEWVPSTVGRSSISYPDHFLAHHQLPRFGVHFLRYDCEGTTWRRAEGADSETEPGAAR